MPKLHEALMNSYTKSGADSVKVLLMTATPITSDTMELIKLLNLCRTVEDQLPTNFEDFAKIYLDENSKFSKRGMRKYLDDIAGNISYLSREKDARQFAQPNIIPILSPISQSDYGQNKIEQLEQEFNNESERNNEEIASIKTKISNIRQERIESKKHIRERCVGLKSDDRASCISGVDNEISFIDKRIDNEIVENMNKMSSLTARNKDMKQDIQLKKKLVLNDQSQQAIIETKCIKKEKKEKKEKKVKKQ
jgi:hypothetical protein